MSLLVSKGLSLRLPSRIVVSCHRSLVQQTPFDLDEGDDEKYRSFNNMYVDMFTPGNDLKAPFNGKEVRKSVNELDEINQEIDQLYNVGYHKITALELENLVKREGRFVLRSLSTDPYYNLALEDYVFSHTPISDRFFSHRLLFYKNDNCVVIGKNQTVWKEVFLNNLAQRGYEFIRRLSGGGAVVHDLGNINYSFITSRKEFDREFFNKLIVKWLINKYPDMPLQLNSRGDITLNGNKVSGSAFKIAKGKAYHHGTMLVQSNLEKFKGLLKPDHIDGLRWNCNSVESVRSKVANIPLRAVHEFIDICVTGWQNHFPLANKVPVYYCDQSVAINDDIKNTISKLKSDEWKYFSGPNFCVKIEQGNHDISVQKGIIVDSTIPGTVGMSFKDFSSSFPKLL
ncbi:biotin/lipoate A/B protein ligase [Zygosaccharomyces mellis]|uniref:Putative lipoate-protein ligase A n=1 Tax=Zygosaccharomyces mellis TaxID=42258 RepID=A0A4C2E4E0_9SACH|nr:biotin/lipoate A/B protein ligase [Zygosaccharomyces mellis]